MGLYRFKTHRTASDLGFMSSASLEAMRVFYRRHVCRAKPVPDEVMSTLAAVGDDPTVYQTMAGPSEFRLTGTAPPATIPSAICP
jgi:hypothetical protein